MFSYPFAKLVKRISQCLLHSKQNHEFTPIYLSLRTESISSSCTYDSDQDLSFEAHKNNYHPCNPHDTQVDITSFPHSFVSFNIQNQYRTLHLPHVLHDFPTKHYKYPPRFDGEYDSLTYEKHLKAFEYFLDLFEVEHDDVCMRDFFQYLQRDVKE